MLCEGRVDDHADVSLTMLIRPQPHHTPCTNPKLNPTHTPAGSLMPGFHSFYWLGLAAATWPRFAWTDGTPGPNTTTYNHWGYYMPQNIIEPNNLFPPELCAGANASQAYDRAWGWADTSCATSAPFVCRRLGGCRRMSAALQQ